MAQDPSEKAAERSRRTLQRGALVFRWVALAWMATLALATEGYRSEALAWASVGAAGAWTVWLTVTPRNRGRAVMWFDLALCAWLLLASGLVVPEEAVTSNRPFFATAYPVSAVLMWAINGGPLQGVFAALVLGVALTLSRPLNGVALNELEPEDVQNLAGAIVQYTVAGAAVGLVAKVLERSGRKLAEATHELVTERERAARLAERESLARQIHDSVLQTLALVHKRAGELSSRDVIPPKEVAELSDIAGRQEQELRTLILRAPQELPSGSASLREALERTARQVDGLEVEVSAVGAIVLEAARVDEIAAAVRQALENVARHAGTQRANVFADEDRDWIAVSVRDDGVGFDYDESRLEKAGKVGMLRSMKGRIVDLGGTMTVESSAGRGSEIEFRVPKEAKVIR